ncbi:MAG TPA: hypothetical protein VGZ47_20450 [Gemmataceae bacterium]|jgi:hypothetical protein|nr:hypothetical protein [Gemmataceae bacterium]
MRYVFVILLLASPAFAGEPVYSWRTRADDPERVYLYLDGNQIGGWDYRAKQYRPFDGKNWGAPADTAPARPPANRVVVMPQQQPMVTTQENLRPLQMRGPLGVRLGTAMGEAMADMTMKMTEEMLRAMLDSLAKGQYKLDFKSSVTPSAQQPEDRTTPPKK